MQKKAIYLSGGGARGAYQAGALTGLNDIIKADKIPVDILSSVSVGSINAAFLAMHAHDFSIGIKKLIELWSSVTSEKIFRIENIFLIKSVLRNLFSMMLHYQAKGGDYLLDTTPLRKLLNENLDFKIINNNIEKGLLTAFEVAAMCYDLSENVSFFKSAQPQVCWKNRWHTSASTNITCQHILASSAMPLFFPAVQIYHHHYGDGGIRLATPLRASIKLGADRILVISTRAKPQLETMQNLTVPQDISFAKILGNMWHALFLDNLDNDIELVKKN